MFVSLSTESVAKVPNYKRSGLRISGNRKFLVQMLINMYRGGQESKCLQLSVKHSYGSVVTRVCFLATVNIDGIKTPDSNAPSNKINFLA